GVTISPTHSAGRGAAEPVELANNLGISCREMSISAAFSGMREALDSGLDEDLEEVVQARLRGGLLMAFASQNHHLLLTSDDKSALAIGNRAIFGDLCGGLAVLSDLPKTWVFKVSRWVNRQR